MKFRFGIEHEVAFYYANDQFADFSNTAFRTFESIVEQLPLYPEDYPQLRVGDAGIKHKRWYVEGFERFDETGKVWDCPPKGIEIRTTVHGSIEGAIAELTDSFQRLVSAASKYELTPALVSFNPNRTAFTPDPPLNDYELRRREDSPEMLTAHIPMLTQGPDLNLSVDGLSSVELIDIGQKLTYYSPWIIPFSFSSPFYDGRTWTGLSARTFYRTGARPAAMVFMKNERDLIDSSPSLTQIARVPAEVGRIEFKAFDSCGDFALYARLFSLLKGLILDRELAGRALVPDAAWHQRSAQRGFDNIDIYEGAKRVLTAAQNALRMHKDTEADLDNLSDLFQQLEQRSCAANEMIGAYQAGGNIRDILVRGYAPLTPWQGNSSSVSLLSMTG